jgi:dTDP-4-dehydrorhamnose 3,5-epimerase
MEFEPTRLPEVLLIKPRVFGDARGYFFETWREDEFAAAGVTAHFVQDNHSHSVRGTLRGLHFQLRRPQGKLLRVTRGEVFDVAVDMRRGSPRFGQWAGVILSESNHQMLWVPPGFAHGYLALSEEIDFVYKCTDFYTPQDERAVRWNDKRVGVQWPLPAGAAPILSARDAAAPPLEEAECYP